MNRLKLISFVGVIAVGAFSQASMFQITITNNGPQPLSPLFWSASDATFDIFHLGAGASAGIKAIAEGGNTAPMLGIAAAAGSAVQSFGVLGGSPLAPGLTRTTMMDFSAGKDYFSFAMMLGKTNDGFLGESVSSQGLRLFNGSTALGFSVNLYGARAWDAGTEFNSQNAADLGFLGGSGNPAETAGQNFVRVHQTVTQGFGDSYALMPDWQTDTRLATLTVLPVPEPTSILALGVGALLVGRKRIRKNG